MNKNFLKTRLKELHTILHQRGYLTTLINKGFKLVEKYHKKNYGTRKTQQWKTPSIHRNLHQKQTRTIPEITKNLEEHQSNDKIKEILDTTENH